MFNSNIESLSMKMSFSRSSSLVSRETKNPIRTILLSCACRIIQAVGRAKSMLLKTTQKKLHNLLHIQFTLRTKNGGTKKIHLGSSRFHYSEGSSWSHLQPFPAPILDGFSVTEPFKDSAGESQLSKYLEWLEEKDRHHYESNNGTISNEGSMDDIDKLADRFIAKCHQKFILEKEESYRRFQEMIAI